VQSERREKRRNKMNKYVQERVRCQMVAKGP